MIECESTTSPDRWSPPAGPLDATDAFVDRHLGPRPADADAMLSAIGAASLDALIDAAVPRGIRCEGDLDLPPPVESERDLVRALGDLAGENQVHRSLLGMGYSDCVTPPVIQRQILENPGWYTQYTPYQAEIAQGRLEALLNFQTMVLDLTGMECANSSLLDEATAAAEAMTLCLRARDRKLGPAKTFFVASDCHPQTIAVVQTRAEPLGIEVTVGDPAHAELGPETFGVLLNYPGTDGKIVDYGPFIEAAQAVGAKAVVATDLLALTLLRPPGEFGADVVVGNSQRFGVPLGYGGPHAAFLATHTAYKRQMPGRVVGVSKDVSGRPALRLALQTREQHIRRERATSNICTAQVLLAVVASCYGVYHGPEGLRRIARRVRNLTHVLGEALAAAGCNVHRDPGSTPCA